MIFTDSMQIPVGAPHAFTAEKLIDFYYDPEIQAAVTAYVNYVPPVKGTKEVLLDKDPEIAENDLIFPDLTNAHNFKTFPPERRARDRRGLPACHRCVNRTRSNLLPYGLLAPGLLWLVVFFAVPLYYMAEISLKTGNDEVGYRLTWHFETYTDALSNYQDQFIRSFEYAGLSTLIALLIAFPLAYVIAFRGGRYKNALLLLVILPFFITYLVRTLSWQTILDDSGWIVELPEDDRRARRRRAPARHQHGRGGGHHLQLPAVHDPAGLRRRSSVWTRACSRRATTSTPSAAT